MSQMLVQSRLNEMLLVEAARFDRASIALQTIPNAEAVHDLRVAIRRWRSLLRTFAPLLRKRQSKALSQELRILAQWLALIREADVLHLALTQMEQHELAEQASRTRTTACDDFQLAMKASPITNTSAKLWAFARKPPVRRKVVEMNTRDQIKVFDRAVVAAAKKYESALVDARKHPSPREMHRLRIIAKQLRYSLEACGQKVAPVTINRDSIERVHDEVGNYLDTIALQTWLENSAQQPAIADELDVEAARMRAKKAIALGMN